MAELSGLGWVVTLAETGGAVMSREIQSRKFPISVSEPACQDLETIFRYRALSLDKWQARELSMSIPRPSVLR